MSILRLHPWLSSGHSVTPFPQELPIWAPGLLFCHSPQPESLAILAGLIDFQNPEATLATGRALSAEPSTKGSGGCIPPALSVSPVSLRFVAPAGSASL